MDINEYKQLHSETIMCYQIMEHDLKFIYAFMLGGDIETNLLKVENNTLGQMVPMLRDLDYSHDNPLISKSDYNFMSQIKDNRNFWAHSCFIEFVYIEKYEKSKIFQKQCEKLYKDHERISRACKILENIRFNYCSKYSK